MPLKVLENNEFMIANILTPADFQEGLRKDGFRAFGAVLGFGVVLFDWLVSLGGFAGLLLVQGWSQVEEPWLCDDLGSVILV